MKSASLKRSRRAPSYARRLDAPQRFHSFPGLKGRAAKAQDEVLGNQANGFLALQGRAWPTIASAPFQG